jgi:acetylornithine deacetylase
VSLSKQEALVLGHLDLEGMLAFLGRLVAVPSVGGAESPAQEMVARWMEENGLEVDLWEVDLPAISSEDAAVVCILRESVSEVLGMEPRLEGVPYGSDLRHRVLEGDTPTVLFGPGEVASAHVPDEAIDVEDLEKAMRTLAVMVLRFCGRPGDD